MPTPQELRFYGLRAGNIARRDVDCHICLDKIKDPVVTECRHVFCWQCLLPWLLEHATCPTCCNDLHVAQLKQQSSEAEQEHQHDGADANYIRAAGSLEGGGFGIQAQITTVVDAVRQLHYTLFELQHHRPTTDSQLNHRTTPSTINPPLRDHEPRSSSRQMDRSLSRNDHAGAGAEQIDVATSFSQGRREIPSDYQFGHRGPPRERHSEDSPTAEFRDEVRDDRNGGSARNRTSRRDPSVTIDSRRMVEAMNVRANDLANEYGIRYSSSYTDATRAVRRHWVKVLERRSGLTMLKDDLMKLLGEQMKVALGNAGTVDFDRGERIPGSVKAYLHDVAEAAVNWE